MPLVLTIDLKNPEPGMVTRAAQTLRDGGLVAFPTETVYGLGVDATSAKAVRRVFDVKGRPAKDPLIVHVLEASDLKVVGSDVPKMARRLAKAFWPGPLTVIVPRGDGIAKAVTGGLKTVAVRSPSHPVARALLSAAAIPIAAPSANPFGRTSPTTANHVLTDLGDKVDIVIDGGPCEVGLESTIVDCTVRPARVVRPGAMTLEAIHEEAPSIKMAEQAVDRRPRAPGRMTQHYAPEATLVMLMGEDADIRAVLAKVSGELSARGQRVGVMAAREDLPWLGNLGHNVRVVALAPLRDVPAAAHDLYATLRELDAMGVATILARDFGAQGLGVAMRDRILKAGAGRCVEIERRGVDAAVRRTLELTEALTKA